MSKCIIRVLDPKGFARAFKLAAGCAMTGSKWSNPICRDVMVDIGNNAVLRATDLQGYITVNLKTLCDFTVDGYGQFFLPVDWKAPSEPFSLVAEPTDEGLKVTCKTQSLETTIPQANAAADYPLFPIGNAGVKFTLPAATLAHELSVLAPMAAREKGATRSTGFCGSSRPRTSPSTPASRPTRCAWWPRMAGVWRLTPCP